MNPLHQFPLRLVRRSRFGEVGKTDLGRHADVRRKVGSEAGKNGAHQVDRLLHQKGAVPSLPGDGLGTSQIQVESDEVGPMTAAGAVEYPQGRRRYHLRLVSGELNDYRPALPGVRRLELGGGTRTRVGSLRASLQAMDLTLHPRPDHGRGVPCSPRVHVQVIRTEILVAAKVGRVDHLGVRQVGPVTARQEAEGQVGLRDHGGDDRPRSAEAVVEGGGGGGGAAVVSGGGGRQPPSAVVTHRR
mmetsp:Transcript_24763/g.72527  ORF Transcript_24763/g.72527 Transcript_24763/m.72527 type:complete len:244 (+) Transcript_24763:1135-1866(+)